MLPNILWIVTTQWRGQALGCAGDVNARTPELDALARSGTLFTQAVTPHPFGPFARAAMLTGVESPANGVRDYFDVLPPGARTIAHDMADRSYSTSFFGKWHLSARDRDAPLTGDVHARQLVPAANQGGFGFWEGFESGFQVNDPWLHGTRLPAPVRFEGYQSDVICGRAAAYLGGVTGPWFSVVSLEAPHPPYAAPAAGVAPVDPSMIAPRINVPLSGPVEERMRSEISGYYAHIEATDRAIGRLVATLPADTVIVFTSVHGDMHGSHGLFRKGWPHEESVRVPLIVRGMGTPGPDSRAISLIDLPAMTAAWGDGKATIPLRSEATSGYARISMPSVVALPDQCDRAWTGLRSMKRKFVSGPGGEHWLHFDLENDPFEMRNLDADPKTASARQGTRSGFSS
ncbi:MAG TPA: sulfatase-like hydrolase/transferase [Opitutaceae bacterium]|jgi:arylsulfatase A-like enzyme|nr:sulfatase-like hydrolase/transferase [Opitutaceae bacterium]